jgi:hypothetical protein
VFAYTGKKNQQQRKYQDGYESSIRGGINFGRSIGGSKIKSRLVREKGLVYNHPCESDKEVHKHT